MLMKNCFKIMLNYVTDIYLPKKKKKRKKEGRKSLRDLTGGAKNEMLGPACNFIFRNPARNCTIIIAYCVNNLQCISYFLLNKKNR